MRSSRSSGRLRRRVAATVLAAIAAGTVGEAFAAPFVPGRGDEVLLEVAPRATRGLLDALENDYHAAPNDAGRAQAYVDALIAAGRRDADARAFGRAEAVLSEWRARPRRPIALDVAWADVLQHRHDYAAARAVLDDVLVRAPAETHARLIRAQLNLSQGRLDDARHDCAALATEGATGVACLAQVFAIAGRLDTADRLLRGLADRGLPPSSTAAWIYTALADVDARRGGTQAVDWLQRATAADPTDHYAQLALVDALLERGDVAAAEARLRVLPRSDGALLRLAICAVRRGTRDGAAEELQARYEELARRGEPVHLRDRARFRLDVRGDVRGALADAVGNFATQREPADVRLLLRAARAANDRAAALPAVQWRTATGYEDAAASQLFAWAGTRS
jgi:predicted Zn-dependent protease